MIKKQILEVQTERYQKLPTWLMVLVVCVMVYAFFIVGSLVSEVFLKIVTSFAMLLNSGLRANIDAFKNSSLGGLVNFPFISLCLFAWVKWYEKRPIRSLGFFKGQVFLELAKGWFIGTLLFSITLGLSFLLGGLEFQTSDFSIKTLEFLVFSIPFWLLQGGTEELLTRGWLLPIIARRLPLAIAIIVTSSLFGIMHLSNNNINFYSVFNIVVIGIFLALYMLKTDNIWGIAGIHGAWNFTQGNIFGISVSGTGAGSSLMHFGQKAGTPDWISGGAFGIEGSLIASLVILVATVYMAWQLVKKEHKA
ncbi:CPBP family intramembrane glutamic endopeptidase [Streptococcus porcinus]|uniref:CPBP family intramembrane metalloprotease n=1 Tax=Streptococcus porcinus TaxID=1340 RepID=A0A7W0AQW2_STRPO|nr:type II CAAX endopeptidase family protein [Streptococcus porcinus]MBA2795616.1 CPBP family intramembrane metalloprotease [Streptococcus porcinus]